MPFRGPSRGADTNALMLPYNLQREQEQTAFDRAMQQAEMAARGARSMGESWNRLQDDNRANEAGQARLAMTPGVREGGAASRWGMSVADSPALQPRSFNQFGKSYSYDPAADAAAQGQGEAVKQSTAESTRVDSLRRVPGITASMASRMVYGRSGVMDPEGDASEMRQRIAEYIQNPSREGAARAIQAGANLNQFPDRFARVQQDPQGGELPIRPEAPIEGSPEWLDMLRKRSAIETDQVRREAPFRAQINAAYRVPPKANWRGISKMDPSTGDEIFGRQNVDTGALEWGGPSGSLKDRAQSIRIPKKFGDPASGTAPAANTPPVAPKVRPRTAPAADSSATPAATGSPADRWEELVSGGMDPAAATAQVRREFNQP